MPFTAQFVTLDELKAIFGEANLINATDDSGAADALNEATLTTVVAGVETEVALALTPRYEAQVDAGQSCPEVKQWVYALLGQELALRTHGLSPEVAQRADRARDALRRVARGELSLYSWTSATVMEIATVESRSKTDIRAPWEEA